MGRYLIQRLLSLIPLAVGVTVMTFAILHFIPGNPLDVMMNPQVTDPQRLAKLQAQLGFRDPWPVQYVRWLGQLLQGNLGYSYLTGQPVASLIGDRLPRTLLLGGAAMALAFAGAIPLGVVSALRRYSAFDRFVTLVSLAGISVPEFFLCLLLVYWIGLQLNILPASGYETLYTQRTGAALWLDRLRHLILPACALALPLMAGVVRFTRSSVLDALSGDYVRTARAKGLPRPRVIYQHILRNALISVITLFGLTIPTVLSGDFVVEYIFGWPGIGTLSVVSVQNREYSIILAVTLLTAVLVLLGNLIADVLYAFADPRIRYA